jgi:hypothetical protein
MAPLVAAALLTHYDKGKGMLSLVFKHRAVKTYGGVEVYIHSYIITAIEGGEWSASRPGRFEATQHPPVTNGGRLDEFQGQPGRDG